MISLRACALLISSCIMAANSQASPYTFELGDALSFSSIEKNSYHLSPSEIYHEIVLLNSTKNSRQVKMALTSSDATLKTPTVLVNSEKITLEKHDNGFYWIQSFPPRGQLRIRIQQDLLWANELNEKFTSNTVACLTEKTKNAKSVKHYSVLKFSKWEKQNMKLSKLVQLDADIPEEQTLVTCPLELKEVEPGLFQYKKNKSYVTTPHLVFVRFTK